MSTNVFTSQVEKHRKQIRLKLKKLSGISNKSLFSKVVRQDILMFGLARTLRIIRLTMQERLAGRKSLVS